VIDATAVIGIVDVTAENALTTTVQITGAQEVAATMAGVAQAATTAGAVAQLQVHLTAERVLADILLVKMGAQNAIHQIITTTTTHQAVVIAGLPPPATMLTVTLVIARTHLAEMIVQDATSTPIITMDGAATAVAIITMVGDLESMDVMVKMLKVQK